MKIKMLGILSLIAGILAACLQATAEEKLLEYAPRVEDVRSRSFIITKSDMLIVNLYGGVLQPTLDPDWFILTKSKNRLPLGELTRIDDSSVTIAFAEGLRGGDGYQLTVKHQAFTTAIAGAVIVNPANSGGWNAAPDFGFGNGAIRGIAYNGSKYIAVGEGGIAASYDGKNWAENTAEKAKWNDSDHVYFRSIVWGADQFVAAGYWVNGGGSNRGVIAVSDADGENWLVLPAPILSYGINNGVTVNVEPLVYGVTWGNGRYVAVGKNGWSAWSHDGLNWTAAHISPFSQLGQEQTNDDANAVAYGGGKFIAGGTRGRLACSDDGATWKWIANELLDGQYNDIFAITFGNGKFIAAGTAGKMKIAGANLAEGADSWAAVQSRFSSGINAVAWGGGQYLAVGDDGRMALSTDGREWLAIPAREDRGWAAGESIYCVTYGSRFVTGGLVNSGGFADAKIVYSE